MNVATEMADNKGRVHIQRTVKWKVIIKIKKGTENMANTLGRKERRVKRLCE